MQRNLQPPHHLSVQGQCCHAPGPHPPVWGPPGGLQHPGKSAGSFPLARHGNFIQQCLQYQHTSTHRPVPVLLIPLPIPYQQVGTDLVLLLPKSAQGHEYVLVLVDYVMRYPVTVPLQKATSRSIAQELVLQWESQKTCSLTREHPSSPS